MDEAGLSQRRILIWGGGAFGVYALLAIAVAAGPIQRDAERRALENLRLAGHGWAKPDAHGRGIAVGGLAPSAEAGAAAVRVAAGDWSARRAWAAFEVQAESAPAAPSGGARKGSLE